MEWKLFLDDIREIDSVLLIYDIDKYKIARSYDEATKLMIEFGCPIFVSFDHDLGWNPRTGKDVANWMVSRDMMMDGKFIPKNFDFQVHSANPIGSENIKVYLNNYLAVRKKWENENL